MEKRNNHLLLGIVIGVAAGFIAGALLTNGKTKKVDKLRSKISNLASDAQEKINALRAMKQTKPESSEN